MHSLEKRLERLEQRFTPNVHIAWVEPGQSKEQALAGRNIPEGDTIHFIGFGDIHQVETELPNESH
jgi:hypothetical protein